jgi:serine/threonine protein kinase
VSFDLWSLAVTLYEALAGFNPFAARDRLGTIEKIKGKGAPDLSTHRPECPQGVSKFLSRALSADIRQRPATAREFGALLSRVLAESTPLAPSTQSDGVHL